MERTPHVFMECTPQLFMENLDSALQEIDLTCQDLFILGDINIDYLDMKAEDTKLLKNFARSNGLHQIINEPTRMSNRKCSCLDMILTNSDFVANSGVLDCNISDHNMVYVTRKKGITIKHKVSYISREIL